MTFLTPIRELLGIPDRFTGRSFTAAVPLPACPDHLELAGDGRSVRWIDEHGTVVSPAPLKAEQVGRYHHRFQEASLIGGIGAATDGRYSGVAPGSNLLLGGSLDYLLSNAGQLGIEAICVTSALTRSGPLVPWQWDPWRRLCEQASAAGVVVAAAVGNTRGSFAPVSLAPSALACGGIELPMRPGDPIQPYHDPAGFSFEGRCVPQVRFPAERVVMASTDPAHDCGIAGVPRGCCVHEGTSWSAPVFIGFLACLAEAYPDLPVPRLADAMREAALAASPRFGPVPVGMPTWAEVVRAIESGTARHREAPNSYSIYDRVQSQPWSQRLDRIEADRAAALEVLLNSLPGPAPDDAYSRLIPLFEESDADAVRAAVVLLCGADVEDERSRRLIEKALNDPSPPVIGCALEHLRNAPAMAEPHGDSLERLLNHPDPRIRHEALRVVETIPLPRFVRPLIDGMPLDLDGGLQFAFFTRRRCLEKITGQTHWPDTRGMLPGECVESDYWLDRQRDCMKKWQSF